MSAAAPAAPGRDTLREVQEIFFSLIAHPEGVRPALEALQSRGFDRARFAALFAGDDRLAAEDRLDIYANMYFFRLLACLEEDFPRTAAWLGHERFHRLIAAYLLAHPSESPSVGDLGRHLPEFAAQRAEAAAFAGLADLARLEWTRARLFTAADAAPATRDSLAALAAEGAGDMRMRFVPAFALLRLEHDVMPLWRVLGDARKLADPAAPDDAATLENLPRAPRRATHVRVWRRDFVVYHKAIDGDEAGALETALAGSGFARLCQNLAAGRSVAKATARAGRLLQEWLEDGILAGFDPPSAGSDAHP